MGHTYVYEIELRSDEVAGHPVQVATVTEGHQGKLLPEFLKHLLLSKETDADACPVVTYPCKLCGRKDTHNRKHIYIATKTRKSVKLL